MRSVFGGEIEQFDQLSHCYIAQQGSLLFTTMVLENGFISAQLRKPLFSFGVISDIQYADIPNGRSFHGVPRYYRHSILVLQRAVQKWNSIENLSFAINFGDIVDGFCPKDQSFNTVKKVVSEFEKFNGPVYHLIGNHCLYNLPREDLLPLLKISTQDNAYAYYDFSPAPGYRFVVLDGYDFSAIGWSQDHPSTVKALDLLNEKNPNSDKNNPDGLVGPQRRFVKFNGGVGKKQLEWFDFVLADATQLSQKVVICCHLALNSDAGSFTALLWNYNEVIDIIHKYKCVKACLTGHDHKGGYTIDSYGIHHRVFEAALDCPPSSNSFGHIEAYEDRLSLIGTDQMRSTEMVFDS